MKEFREYVLQNQGAVQKIAALKTKVEEFARSYPMPGMDDR